MAKTKITHEHREAADAVVASLAELGIEATAHEVLLAGAIANAVSAIVSATILETPEGEELPDFSLARQLFDSRGEPIDAAAVTLRTLAIARGLLGARRMTASMSQQAQHIARGLVEMFEAMNLPATPSQTSETTSAEQPERAPDEPRLRLKLDPDLADGFHWTIHDEPDAVLMQNIKTWMENAVVGDDFTIELVSMTDAEVEVEALPDV